MADLKVVEALDRDEETRADLQRVFGPLVLPKQYVPVEPTPKQEWFLLHDGEECFTGGSAGGGKTWSMLMAALQYVDRPGYQAAIFRPTLTEFHVPGGIHEVAQDWLTFTDAQWIGGPVPQWRFPSGATLTYGYLSNVNDVDRYKGGALAFIGFDELVGFGLREYLGLRRLLRTGVTSIPGIPMRIRSASNPSTSPKTMKNQTWIKQRFIDPKTRPAGVTFVPSGLEDNPHIDRAAYMERLSHLLPADRERLIHGDWDVMEEGALFKREHFRIVSRAEVKPPISVARYWDLAATEESAQDIDPDWTIGLRLQVDADGMFTISDIVRGRFAAHVVEQVVKQTAQVDQASFTCPVMIWMEQEPGASGKIVVSYFIRSVLSGYAARGVPSTGDKFTRAIPAAAAAGNGLMQIVEGCPNTLEFLDEVASFRPGAAHDDCVDALSGAHTALTRGGALGGVTIGVPQGRLPGVAESPFRGRDRPQPRGIPVGPTHLRRR